ncbi:S-adenosylmethionine:tRNA ribosyltransferase-isomerase [Tumebacillus permanentifrigoris]|uniref:S-adenosylmethionine:tRNA ribosyltransferase-isomerase n=1 Tax=Tumebacillus permanentifrigoris TaxID=378543 RepID=A0A316DA31_9BACL|nr:S-adenosylmethionine:tRNA ribosyltransferase-isomerase [Tumebacillus permanentifrigoris]PWK14345.1 S-adenosylmethionine:tRNA ribosyltransferase-isomerase [Tumebacillus permanentifrigoris]
MEARHLHQFHLPDALNATTPPERRGVRRDHVQMMVLDRATGQTQHETFFQLDRFLKPGDLLILNASRTVPAVLKATRLAGAEHVEVRLAHRLDESVWQALVVAQGVCIGERLRFSPTLEAEVVAQQTGRPFVTLQFSREGAALYDEIYQLGEPVRYEYIHTDWGLDYYQTVYASVPGSVEMPSAGRAFSWELLFKLQRKGVRLAYMQLHTGLSYLLDDRWHQDPRENIEQYMIPQETVEAVEQCKAAGGRVIAVGTTVVRSLETAVDTDGILRAQSGWTNLYIHDRYPLRVVDGLITGFHEPEASHLDLLSAFVKPELLYAAYQEAIDRQYLWHEFGDMNLIL